jgi:predicted component of type VI protein secretion system
MSSVSIAAFHLRTRAPDDTLSVGSIISSAAMRIHVPSDRDESTMNYVLQVVRGRSASTTLKLADGVTAIGRHDDCLIRIKSSQVSRRHCEIFEVADKLTIRDLGSSNGTFVNGKKVSGQQVLKHGDELTVGAVTLRVAKLGQPVASPEPSPISKPKAADTAVLEAIAAEEEQEEFEMEFDDGDPEPEVEGIPLVDEDTAKPAKPKSSPKVVASAASSSSTAKQAGAPPAAGEAKEDDAIAQFLLDLKLDDGE